MPPLPPPASAGRRPAAWTFVLAFTLLYLGYGLNFLAVRVGVESLPPFLFAGAHILLAGLVLWLWQLARHQPTRLPWQGVRRAAAAALFLFVGGVGLVTVGESLGVESSVAAVIKASAPLWIAVLETFRPHGEKASLRTFAGLAIGATGVILMAAPEFGPAALHPLGIGLLVASAFFFAIGTILVRHRPPSDNVVTSVFHQMILGGCYLLLLGFAFGEHGRISLASLTPSAIEAFAFLLVVHSIGAFMALNWLLRWFPAPIVATKFYVSPAIAVTAGWLVLGEPISTRKIGCMLLILAGVAVLLVRNRQRNPPLAPQDADELEE